MVVGWLLVTMSYSVIRHQRLAAAADGTAACLVSMPPSSLAYATHFITVELSAVYLYCTTVCVFAGSDRRAD